MRRSGSFCLGVVLLALACTLARSWQRAVAFEPDTGLLIPGQGATWCVVILAGLSALALIPLSRWAAGEEQGPGGYLAAFALPHRGLMVVYILSGALLAAAGVLGIWEYRMGLFDQPSRMVFSVGLLPTGVDMALVGWLNAQRSESRGRFAWPLLLPGYCGCLWLISAYQGHTANPNPMAYAFYFFGAVCAAGACCAMASFSFEKPQGALCLWLSGMGGVFLSMSAADFVCWGNRQALLVCLGYILYLAVQTKCYLYRRSHPAPLERWQPPRQLSPDGAEDKNETEIEVTDRER